MKLKNLSLGIGLVAGMIATPGFAQTTAPAGVPVGPGYLFPLLDVELFHDDNMFNAEPGSEVDSWGWKVSPNLTYDVSNNIQRFALNWDLEAGFYDATDVDDYVDNTVSGVFEYAPTDRFDSSVRAEYRDTRDPRGTGRAEGIITGLDQDPDEWHSYAIDGSVGYGAATTPARVEGDLGFVSKTYDNNLASTIFRNRDDTTAAGRFFYRVAPKTSVVLEGRYADASYDTASPISGSLDSETYSLLGGLTWETTAITTATFKLGYITKDFDLASRADGDAFTWEGNLQWAPRTYSVVNLNTARSFNETDGTGNYIQADSFSFDWTHGWSERISTVADISYSNDTFDPTTREDDRFYAGLRVSYLFQRWLTVSGGYRYEDRDSNRDAFDYTKNLFMLTATMSL